jgi:hypothetical protein
MAVIAATPPGVWESGCRALGQDYVAMPTPSAGDLRARLATGTAALAALAGREVEFILDLNGAGLTFVEGPSGFTDLKLTHEQLSATLVSQMIVPIPVLAQQLGWDVLATCLNSRRWIKVIGDAEAAQELHRFGIPGIAHLPPAAIDSAINMPPPDPAAIEAEVAFVGDAGTSLFQGPLAERCEEDLSPAARAAITAAGRVPFFVSYFEIDRVAPLPPAQDAATTRSAAMADYYAARTRYACAICRQDRDRLVALLADRAESPLMIHGRGWGDVSNTVMTPAPTTAAEYMGRFRRAAINVVTGDGWTESGLSMSHFEVTAAGGLLLCPYHPRLRDYFALGHEIDTFSSDEELFAKIDHYLQNPDQRLAVATAGQQRTHRNHLIGHRLEAILRMAGVTTPQNDAASTEPTPTSDGGFRIAVEPAGAAR